jgi:cytochrome c556
MNKLALALSLLACSAAGAAADPAEEREEYMKENGRLLGQLAPIAKGEKEFDAAEVKSLLQAFGEHAQELDVVAQFPEGTGGRPTRAAPAIWQNWEDFQAKAEKFKADAAAAARSDPQSPQELGAQIAAIGNNCKSCHEDYRLPEE